MSETKRSNLRLCHLADVHLGYRRFSRLTKLGFNQREVDVNLAFREAIDRILSLKPDLVIIAGDLFHSVRPSNSILNFAFREVRRLGRGMTGPIVIVAGNHESPRRADSGSPIRILSEIERVFVVDSKIEQLSFNELDLSVTCLPHLALARNEQLRLRADDKFSHNILVVHAQVQGATLTDFGGAQLDLNQAAVLEWDYVALGHAHVHTDIGLNAAYSGAIENTASNLWANAGAQKGFIEVMLGTGQRIFHNLTSARAVIILDSIDAGACDPVELLELIKLRINSVGGGIGGKIVRLQIDNISRETFRQLDHRELKRLKADALNFTLEIMPPRASSSVEPKGAAAFSGVDRLVAELIEYSRQSSPGSGALLAQLLEGYIKKIEANNEAS